MNHFVFSLGPRKYAVPKKYFEYHLWKEKFEHGKEGPDYCRGVVILNHTQVVPILDLRLLVGEKEIKESSELLVISLHSVMLALVVDNMSLKAKEFDEGEITPVTRAEKEIGFISGLAKVGRVTVRIIDPEKLVAIALDKLLIDTALKRSPF